jgi:hypothetical protein
LLLKLIELLLQRLNLLAQRVNLRVGGLTRRRSLRVSRSRSQRRRRQHDRQPIPRFHVVPAFGKKITRAA